MTGIAHDLLKTLTRIYQETGTEVFTPKHYGQIANYESAITELINLGILKKFISGNLAFTQDYKDENF